MARKIRTDGHKHIHLSKIVTAMSLFTISRLDKNYCNCVTFTPTANIHIFSNHPLYSQKIELMQLLIDLQNHVKNNTVF